MRTELPLGKGPAVFVGDPLASLGTDVIPREVSDLRSLPLDVPYPDSAALVAELSVAALQPRLVVESG